MDSVHRPQAVSPLPNDKLSSVKEKRLIKRHDVERLPVRLETAHEQGKLTATQPGGVVTVGALGQRRGEFELRQQADDNLLSTQQRLHHLGGIRFTDQVRPKESGGIEEEDLARPGRGTQRSRSRKSLS